MIKKKWFTVSNLITVGLFVFAAAMLLSPQLKAWTIQNLMKIGLFQPRIENYDQNVLKDNATAGLLPGVRFVNENGQTTDLANLKGKVVNLSTLMVTTIRKYQIAVSDLMNYKSIYQILFIANEYAEASSNLHSASLAAVGLTLLLISMEVNFVARLIIKRARRNS